MKPRKAFLLRLDPKLYAEIEAWAADELRSTNSQIEFVLSSAVSKRKKTMQKSNENRQTEKPESSSS